MLGLPPSVFMPVMDIRKVRVAMEYGGVFVHMAMRLRCIPLKGVFMLMVLVVNVLMVMCLRIVLMFV